MLAADSASVNVNSTALPATIRLSTLPVEMQSAWNSVAADPSFQPFGELAELKIGVVTGANSFFVRTQEDIDQFEDHVSTVPIVSRAKWLKSPLWRVSDQRSLESAGTHCRLLRLEPPPAQGASNLKLLNDGVRLGLPHRFKCGSRNPWYLQHDTKAPNAFLQDMGALAPTIVLNETDATCTNAIHRVWWKPRVTGGERDVSLLCGELLSTFADRNERRVRRARRGACALGTTASTAHSHAAGKPGQRHPRS